MDYYNRVLSRFPNHSWSDDCLYRIAVIQFNKLDDPQAAIRSCNRLLKNYSKGDMWPKAQELLKEIKGNDDVPNPDDKPVLAAKETPPVKETAKPEPQKDSLAAQIKQIEERKATAQQKAAQKAVQQAVAQEEDEGMHVADDTAPPAPGGRRELKNVRFQSSDEYTRVVINLDYETPFRYQLLGPNDAYKRPHRLYIDLENTVLSPKIDRHVDVADGILRRVRIAQNTPTITRVVLIFRTCRTTRSLPCTTRTG